MKLVDGALFGHHKRGTHVQCEGSGIVIAEPRVDDDAYELEVPDAKPVVTGMVVRIEPEPPPVRAIPIDYRADSSVRSYRGGLPG